MNYIGRTLGEKLEKLASHFPVVVVSGARQVGKSTLVRHHFAGWGCVVLDPVQDIGNARADPTLFLENHRCPLILDEIQYCPELVPLIKRKVDEDKRPGMFILTGSQQWSVLKSVSESLAGRAVFLDLEGFSLRETRGQAGQRSWIERFLDDPEGFCAATQVRLPEGLSPYETLWRGSLPEMQSLPMEFCHDWMGGYLRTYIERDVRLLLDAGDWQQFGNFVRLLSALTAQETNHSQLGRETGITPQTAKRWLATLRGTFQWHEIPAYHGNLLKRISQKPKGYFQDTGLACHLNRITSPEALGGHPLAGALFETFVAGEIRKALATLPYPVQTYHWRIHSGSEVDLVIEKDNRLHPIEIKLHSSPTRKDTRGLKVFREHYTPEKVAPGLVIAPANHFERITENDYVLPWDLA